MIAELATTTLTTSPSSVKWSTLIFGAGHSREVQKYESMKDVAKTDKKTWVSAGVLYRLPKTYG